MGFKWYVGPCVIYTCKYEETEHDVCVCVCVDRVAYITAPY